MERSKEETVVKRLAAMRELSLQGIRAHAGGLRTAGVRDGVEYMELIGPCDARDVLLTFTVVGASLIWITDAATVELVGDNGCSGPGAPVVGTVVFGAVDRAVMLGLQADGRNLHDTGDLRTAVFYARELARPGYRVLLAVSGPPGEGQSGPFHQAVKDL